MKIFGPVPLFIAGLVLRLTNGWFSGQHALGDALMWAGAGLFLLGFIIFAIILTIAASGNRRF